MSALLLGSTAALLLSAIVTLKFAQREQLGRELVTYRLVFPRGLEADAVGAFVDGLSGLLLPWWKRWLVVPVVTGMVTASSTGIEHFVSVPERWSTAIE